MLGSLGGVGKLITDLIDGKNGPVSGAVNNIDPQALAKLGPPLQKAAYMAALHQAIAKAERSPSFNLETHKNDLWINLGNITNQNVKKSQAMQAVLSNQAQMQNILSSMTKQMSNMSKQILQNMR